MSPVGQGRRRPGLFHVCLLRSMAGCFLLATYYGTHVGERAAVISATACLVTPANLSTFICSAPICLGLWRRQGSFGFALAFLGGACRHAGWLKVALGRPLSWCCRASSTKGIRSLMMRPQAEWKGQGDDAQGNAQHTRDWSSRYHDPTRAAFIVHGGVCFEMKPQVWVKARSKTANA